MCDCRPLPPQLPFWSRCGLFPWQYSRKRALANTICRLLLTLELCGHFCSNYLAAVTCGLQFGPVFAGWRSLRCLAHGGLRLRVGTGLLPKRCRRLIEAAIKHLPAVAECSTFSYRPVPCQATQARTIPEWRNEAVWITAFAQIAVLAGAEAVMLNVPVPFYINANSIIIFVAVAVHFLRSAQADKAV